MQNKRFSVALTAAEIKDLDQKTIDSGTPGQELMERAGKKIFEELKADNSLDLSRTIIFCGAGNNGGDGLVIAQNLYAHNYRPVVIILRSERYSPDFSLKLEKLNSSISEIIYFPDCQENMNDLLSNASLLIDCIFGVGPTTALRGDVLKLLEIINTSKGSALKVSVDLPSGIHPDSGAKLCPDPFSADYTFTIEYLKCGLLQDPARTFAGKIKLISIGLLDINNAEYQLTTANNIKLEREYSAHKGSQGKVFVIGAASKYPGAGDLTALAALKTGAGLVLKTESPGQRSVYPEVIQERISGEFLSEQDLSSLLEQCEQVNAIVIGPGLGTEAETREVLYDLLHQSKKPAVIDADALNLIASFNQQELSKLNFSEAIFTPHPKEAARLLNTTVTDVQTNRYAAASALEEKYGACIVLKGAGTIVQRKDRKYINLTGNPYMATAGSGDVLAGIIGGLIAQGVKDLESAASFAVALHGLAGNYAHQQAKGPIIASEIIMQIGSALSRLFSTEQNNQEELFYETLNYNF